MDNIINATRIVYVHAATQMGNADTSTSCPIRPQPYNHICTFDPTGTTTYPHNIDNNPLPRESRTTRT